MATDSTQRLVARYRTGARLDTGEPIFGSGHENVGRDLVYQSVLTWCLLLPLLYIVANGQISVTSPSNSAVATQNGALLMMERGVRPDVVICYGLLALFIFSCYRGIWRSINQNKLLFFGVIWAVFSAVWSTSSSLTLRMSAELMLTTLFAFYLVERFSPERLMKMLILVGTVAAVSSLMLVAFFPQYGIYQRDASGAWQGICNHKNFLGLGMTFLLTPVFFVSMRMYLKVVYTILMLSLVAMSQSRGAWFAAIMMLAFVGGGFIYRRLGSREKTLLALAIGAVVCITAFTVVLYLEPLARAIGKDPTLTGRIPIYREVFDAIVKHPIFGYGYGAFWQRSNPEATLIGLDIHWPTIGYAENGILELWLELGTIGIVLALASIARGIGQGLKLIRSPAYKPQIAWYMLLIFLELITNIEAGLVMVPISLQWTLTLIALIGLTNEFNSAAKQIRTPSSLKA